jgi:DNA-directed RNA polymerase subunit M/transcription elongation factor TFIIS
MSAIYGICLQAKGDIKRIKLADTKSNLTADSLQTIVKKKTPLSELGAYVYGDYTLTLFGYTHGKAGTENKHELPTPLDETPYFSDILVIASKSPATWETPITFTPEQYEKFYTKAFGGFDDDEDDSESSESEEEEEKEPEVEDVEEAVQTSKKKKAAEEDGEPEDEGEEEEDVEEEEEDEEEEEAGGEEEEVAGYEENEPKPKARAVKKKAVKPNMTVVQNTGRARQQALLMRIGFAEITVATAIPKEECKERELRSHVSELIKKHLPKLPAKQQTRLEFAILQNALTDADGKHVLKHFDNQLFHICYTSAARRFLSNIDPNNYVANPVLHKRLVEGKLLPEHIASMTIQDYYPELYTELNDRQLKREQQQLEGNKSLATDLFECFRCNTRQTVFYELQTRSADEPMTKFITCVNCNNHWRM